MILLKIHKVYSKFCYIGTLDSFTLLLYVAIYTL